MSSTPATAGGPVRTAREVTPELERRLSRLRVWNIGVGVVLALEAVAIALLTNGFTLPVTATYMTGPPGAADLRLRHHHQPVHLLQRLRHQHVAAVPQSGQVA
jgi:hypothetical protein